MLERNKKQTIVQLQCRNEKQLFFLSQEIRHS